MLLFGGVDIFCFVFFLPGGSERLGHDNCVEQPFIDTPNNSTSNVGRASTAVDEFYAKRATI